MRTTVLVLSVDEAHRLEHCLPAALAQPGEVRVVVVDDASTDATAAVCARLRVEVVPLTVRVSYAAAVNAGLRATAGDDDAVLLLNADCVLDGGFLAAAGAALRDPAVGSVAPRLLRATGPRPADRLELLDAAGMVVDRRRKNGLVGHGEPATAFARGGPCFGGDGACVLYRRATLDAVALDGETLDEDLALWASDADLAWRAQRAGWACAYVPGAVAWHERFYSPTTRATVAEHHRRLQFRNRLLMVLKHETPRTLARDGARIGAYELLALGHVLLRERHLLGAYADAWRLRGGALRRRRAMRAVGGSGRRVPFGLVPPRRAG